MQSANTESRGLPVFFSHMIVRANRVMRGDANASDAREWSSTREMARFKVCGGPCRPWNDELYRRELLLLGPMSFIDGELLFSVGLCVSEWASCTQKWKNCV